MSPLTGVGTPLVALCCGMKQGRQILKLQRAWQAFTYEQYDGAMHSRLRYESVQLSSGIVRAPIERRVAQSASLCAP